MNSPCLRVEYSRIQAIRWDSTLSLPARGQVRGAAEAGQIWALNCPGPGVGRVENREDGALLDETEPPRQFVSIDGIAISQVAGLPDQAGVTHQECGAQTVGVTPTNVDKDIGILG